MGRARAAGARTKGKHKREAHMLLLANVPFFGPSSGPAEPAVHLARRPPPPGLTDDPAAVTAAPGAAPRLPGSPTTLLR